MCGHVGAAGDFMPATKEAFTQLLIIDSLRGPHSTGVLGVNTKKEYSISKALGNAYELIDHKSYSKTIEGSINLLLGHNRWATKGKINRMNAHPFECGNIIGAHNGTLREYSQLPDHKLFDVDSECLINAIDALGIDAAISKIHGAYALVWFDKANDTLNFLRNEERSFFYTFSITNKTLFWASEAEMLTLILARNKIQHGEIIETKPNFMYTFKIDFAYNPKAFDKVHVRRVEPRPYQYYTGGVGQNLLNFPVQEQKTQAAVIKREEESSLNGVDLSRFCNKEVHFVYEGYESDSPAGPHLRFSDLQNPNVEIRYFLGDDRIGSADWLRKPFAVYRGKVKSVRILGNHGYCALDKRTVTLVESNYNKPAVNENAKNVFTVEGYNKDKLTIYEFNLMVEQGCAWCSHTPTIKESSSLLWLDNKYFLCKDCKIDPECKQYLIN